MRNFLDMFERRKSGFDEHFNDIRNMQKRMFWMAPLILILNAVLGLAFLAAAVFIVLALLRWFGVV